MKRFFALLSLALLAASATAPAATLKYMAKNVARSSPFNLVGQVFFDNGGDSYIGSGTVIRKSSILTAGHNIYDPDNGWSTDMLFRRGAYGDTALGELYAQRIFLLGGYRQATQRYGTSSTRSFSVDTGGVRFALALARGASASWTSNPSVLASASRYKRAVGYGAEGDHDGDYPLFVVPDRGFTSTYGSFWESRGLYFEGGMSGGPVFVLNDNGTYSVAAVIVSGARFPYSRGGVRVIDSTTASFINNYLR